MALKLWGALLVILSGAGAGLSMAGEERRTMRLAETAERMLLQLQTLVCAQRLPLPEAISVLHKEYPDWIPDRESLNHALRTRSFGEVWADHVEELSLPEKLQSLLAPLGRKLSAGEEPERCFAGTLSELRSLREQWAARTRETARLYPALGLSAGVLTAIVLL